MSRQIESGKTGAGVEEGEGAGTGRKTGETTGTGEPPAAAGGAPAGTAEAKETSASAPSGADDRTASQAVLDAKADCDATIGITTILLVTLSLAVFSILMASTMPFTWPLIKIIAALGVALNVGASITFAWRCRLRPPSALLPSVASAASLAFLILALRAGDGEETAQLLINSILCAIAAVAQILFLLPSLSKNEPSKKQCPSREPIGAKAHDNPERDGHGTAPPGRA